MEEKENIVNKPNTLVQQKDLVNDLLPLPGDFHVLPREILFDEILKYLDILDLYYLGLTCKDIREPVFFIYTQKKGGFVNKGSPNIYNIQTSLDLQKRLEYRNSWLFAKNLNIVKGSSIDNQKLLKDLAELKIFGLINCEIDIELLELILTYATKLRVVVLKNLSLSIPFELILKLSELEELRISEPFCKADGKAAFYRTLRILEWDNQFMKIFPSWMPTLTNLTSFEVPRSAIIEIPTGLPLMQTLKKLELYSCYPITNSKDFNSSTMPQLQRRVL